MRILSLAVIEDWRFSDMVSRVWGIVERTAPLRGALQKIKLQPSDLWWIRLVATGLRGRPTVSHISPKTSEIWGTADSGSKCNIS
jgi:hypothetical protein